MENKIVEVFCEQVISEWSNRTRGVGAHIAGAWAAGVTHNAIHNTHMARQIAKHPGNFEHAFDVGFKGMIHKMKWVIPVNLFGAAMVALYKRTFSKFKECNKTHGQVSRPEANAQCRLTYSKKMLELGHKMSSKCASLAAEEKSKCQESANSEISKWTHYVEKYQKMIKYYY